MKKRICIFLSALTALCMLAGCAFSGNSAEATTEGYEMAQPDPIVIDNPAQYVKLGKYKGLEIKKMSTEVTDEEVEAEIKDNLGIEYTEIKGRKDVQAKDVVNVDYVTSFKGKADDEWSDTGLDIPLDQGDYFDYLVDDVCKELIGKKVGDTVTVKSKFNDVDETGHEGQECTMEFTINKIQEAHVPELTDKYVEDHFGYKTVEEWRSELRKEMEETRQMEAEDANISTLIGTIIDGSKQVKDFPASLISKAKENIEIEEGANAELYGMTLEDYLNEFYQLSEDELAVSMLKENCVWAQLAEELDVEVTQEEIDQMYKDLAQDYGSEEEARNQLSEAQIKENVEEEKIVEKLQELNKFVD